MLLNMSTFVERFYFKLPWQIMENNVKYNHPKWKKVVMIMIFYFILFCSIFYIIKNLLAKIIARKIQKNVINLVEGNHK